MRWGARGARWIYGGLTTIALAAGLGAVVRHALPVWYVAPAVTLASFGFWAVRGISMEREERNRLKRSIELTLGIHAIGCVTTIAALLLSRTP